MFDIRAGKYHVSKLQKESMPYIAAFIKAPVVFGSTYTHTLMHLAHIRDPRNSTVLWGETHYPRNANWPGTRAIGHFSRMLY